MGIFDDELDEQFDQKLLEDFCKNFEIDYKKHIKPGHDCMGNKIKPGDIVFVISPSTITKTRLIPGVVIKHTKVKTQVLSAFSYDKRVWGKDENGNWCDTGEVNVKHSSFYPEQIIKADIEKMIELKNAINK